MEKANRLEVTDMIIHRDDVQAVRKFKELKAYCKHKACDICVFYNECPFKYNEENRDKVEEAACDILVFGAFGEDLTEGDKNE